MTDKSSKAIDRAAGLLLLVILLAGSVKGQQITPLRVEDLLDARSFGALSPVAFSPDSAWLAFAAVTSNNGDNQRKAYSPQEALLTGVPTIVKGQDIWVVGTAGGEARNLTEGTGSSWAPSWSPDGHYLAFLSDRGGGEQPKLWVWDVGANELRKVSDAAVRAWEEEIQWLPDSKSVLVPMLPEELSPEEYAKRLSRPGSSEPERITTPNSRVVVNRFVPRSPGDKAKEQLGPWSLDYALRDLGRIELSTGKVERIVRGRRISHYALSPDGARIALKSPTHFEREGSQQTIYDIVTLDLSTRQERIVVPNVRLDGAFGFSWSPDSSLLAYHVAGVEANRDLFVVNACGGEPRNMTKFPTQPSPDLASPPLWDTKGENIYFVNYGALWKASVMQGNAAKLVTIPGRRIVGVIAQSRGLLWSPNAEESAAVLADDSETVQSGIYKVDLRTGGVHVLSENGRCYDCARQGEHHVVVSPDGHKVAYFASDAQHDNDLWLAGADFKASRRLTHLNAQLDKYRMGAARLIQWLSVDGEPLKGALLLPAGYREGQRYPMVVSVYGGSLHSHHLANFGLDVLPFNMQLLATRGYAVLVPDAPQHLGTPMTDLAKTVLPGVNKVIEMGIADPEHLGIIGHSYGGYSALALIVQTTRFKGAVMSAGFGDLIAGYGEMHEDGSAYMVGVLEHAQGLMGGTPWQFRQRYIENSPIFYLDRIETPLLIVHGGADEAVDPFLAGEVFVGLRRLGKEVEFARYEGEDHAELTWGYANQLDVINRVIGWFDEHVKKTSGSTPATQKPN